MDRKPLSKKLRFEVFKRDSFTCQYCGKKAPDIVLHVDHIIPVASGGENLITNLITSCAECNLGKGAREISDDSVVAHQHRQLEALQERREQIEMMLEWQSGLLDIENDQVNGVAEYFSKLVPGYSLSDSGIAKLKFHIRKFGLSEILAVMKISIDQYLQFSGGSVTQQSVEKAIQMIPKICKVRQSNDYCSDTKDILYIRAIVRNRLGGRDWEILSILKKAYKAGVTIPELRTVALSKEDYDDWVQEMEWWREIYEQMNKEDTHHD